MTNMQTVKRPPFQSYSSWYYSLASYLLASAIRNDLFIYLFISLFLCDFDKRHHGKSIAATFYVILVTSTVSCILYLVTCCCAATEVQPHHVFRCRLVTHWNLLHLDMTSFSALNSNLSDKQNASKASFLEPRKSEKVEGLTPLSPFLTPVVKYSQKSQHHV